MSCNEALDLDEITHNTAMRSLRWLERHGYLAGTSEIEPPPPSVLDACLESSLGLDGLVRLKTSGKTAPVASPATNSCTSTKRSTLGAFNVHAGVTASTRDDRKRLLRYCARPPLSLERLSLTKDGQVAYALKRPIRGATHRVLTPLAFLARLCALIPPPRHPLIRFRGVFAPHSALRKRVVPTPTTTSKAIEAPRSERAPKPPLAAKPKPESTWNAARLDWPRCSAGSTTSTR